MSKFQSVLEFLRWPVLVGVLAALVISEYFPQFAPSKDTGNDSSFPYDALSPEQNDWSGPVSYSEAVRRASPAVVNIYTSKKVNNSNHPLLNDPVLRRLFNVSELPQQQRMHSALGSGVIVSQDGYLLTNEHLISGADEIVVALQDGRDAKAELIGVNKESDLAVLKIELDNLQAIPIGSPESVKVGDVVLAIGNPFGMGQTVTQGIVSATRRRGLSISEYENFIQTDAAINPGNSGGALIDAHGNFLGINTAQFSQQMQSGFGFAIPADIALQTLKDIIEYGHVVRGWLGIEAIPISPRTARAFKLNDTDGIIITRVVPEGPAAAAGLHVKDIITHINNRSVGGGIWGEQEINESRPGETVDIRLIRNGEVMEMQATVAAVPTQLQVQQ